MRIEEKLHAAFLKSQKTLALAESCTGGAMASALTAIPGASHFLLGSLVVYSNTWKEEFLGVSPRTLQTKGAVSAEVVEEMVRGLFHRTQCDFAAAVSGIAGPSGGTSEKPVGTIFIAIGKRGDFMDVQRLQAPKDRRGAIAFAVETTFEALLKQVHS
ncbi:MAG TPA: CinA family protein [Chlamydiales bacterium]|jgi:nicotinamide-nucleotide amidase|nr:CinA family protein [Chlamydiales bacterium]